MQRPRRTTEYETPSEKARQSRPSRLQQPIRRPSIRDGSLTRGSSAEPLSSLATGTGNHLAVPTSTKRQRSSSVSNVRTPQRTPTHFTPKGQQFTGEKQRAPVNDKRWIQEQVVRITEYLKTVDCGIGVEFLHRGGLKTMSMKQFIGLVNYFLKFLAGNKFTVGANHVESILKILNQIEYPYTVNKSWLKTPTAPHAFGNAVMLFSFFMEFIPPPDNIETFKKNHLIVSEEFPDMDFAFKLSNMAEEGFSLWNNQKNEEFEKLQKTAVDELIFKKVSITSLDAFDKEIESLNADLDRIAAKKAIVQKDEEYCRFDKEVKTNQRQITKLQKICQSNQKTINNLKLEISAKGELIEKLKSRVEDILNVVNNQKMSVKDRNKLIEDVGHMQYILKTKKQAVFDLQEMDNQSQIRLSRQIKQLTEKIAKFNSYIRQTMMDFEDLNVDIESLCLHQNSEIEIQDQINKVEEFLKKLQRHITIRMTELSKHIDSFQTQINLISYELSEFIEPKIEELTETIKEHQKKLDELHREIIAVKNCTTSRQNELSQKIKQSELTIISLKDSIEKNRKEIVETRDENKAMMALVSDRFEEFFAARDERLKQFNEALQRLQKICAEAKALMK